MSGLTVSWHPHSPGSHDSRFEISLELLDVIVPRFAFDEIQISEKHKTKDGVPHGLINKDLGGNRDGLGPGKLAVQKAVEIVTGTSVDEKSKGSQTNSAHDIVWLAILFDKSLRQDISSGESSQGCQTLGQERLRLQQLVVTSPKTRHFVCVFVARDYKL
jgi:hypothetical protein